MEAVILAFRSFCIPALTRRELLASSVFRSQEWILSFSSSVWKQAVPFYLILTRS